MRRVWAAGHRCFRAALFACSRRVRLPPLEQHRDFEVQTRRCRGARLATPTQRPAGVEGTLQFKVMGGTVTVALRHRPLRRQQEIVSEVEGTVYRLSCNMIIPTTRGIARPAPTSAASNASNDRAPKPSTAIYGKASSTPSTMASLKTTRYMLLSPATRTSPERVKK